MLLKEFSLGDYMFGDNRDKLSEEKATHIEHRLRQEMLEIFYGHNITNEHMWPQLH